MYLSERLDAHNTLRRTCSELVVPAVGIHFLSAPEAVVDEDALDVRRGHARPAQLVVRDLAPEALHRVPVRV